ncbi:hypothetical protein CRG98_014668 [Punica granatum]|uniref:Uncharacterized protein n=1 Tax=Punica granatum TaxID=22663 RepID=A0A2I0KAX9_PUNGR|nr:hypothetical protein CRG98_014668 [Punica granatum]
MLGWSPKAINAGPGPESNKCRTNARYGAEAQNWGQSPTRGRSPMRGQNPKAGPKPDAVNVGPEPNAGPKPDAVNACSIRKCKRCKSKDAVEGPDGLSHEGYLITTPSDHLEDNAGQGRIDEAMRAKE